MLPDSRHLQLRRRRRTDGTRFDPKAVLPKATRVAPAPSTFCAFLALVGCAQVTVHQGDGALIEHNRFGIVTIDTGPGTTPQIVDVEAFGLLARNGSMSLGYEASSVSVLPRDDCRIVFWIDAGTDTRALESLIVGRDDICRVGPGAHDQTTLTSTPPTGAHWHTGRGP